MAPSGIAPSHLEFLFEMLTSVIVFNETSCIFLINMNATLLIKVYLRANYALLHSQFFKSGEILRG